MSMSISAVDVILSCDLEDEMILMISAIAYFIYKSWLAESFDNEDRVLDNCIHNLLHFIKYKRSIYANVTKTHKTSVMLDMFT